jgi:hypothetical protein
VLGRDVGHAGDGGIGLLQSTTRHLHTAQHNILPGAHPEDLPASSPQGSARNSELPDYVPHWQRLERLRADQLEEPMYYELMMLPADGIGALRVGAQKPLHGHDEAMLEIVGQFGVSQHFRNGFGEAAHVVVQRAKVRQRCGWWRNDSHPAHPVRARAGLDHAKRFHIVFRKGHRTPSRCPR